jgi:hypothetical protein
MQEALPIRQSITAKDLLWLVAPGIFLGLLVAIVLPLPRANALSLSLGGELHASLLSPVSITSDISLLEPQSILKAKVSASPVTLAPNAPPRLIGIAVAAHSATPAVPPVGSVVQPPTATPTRPIASPADSLGVPAAVKTKSNTALVSAKPALKATPQPTAPTAPNTPKPRNFLGFTLPNGFGTLPETIGSRDDTFRTILVILTSLTVLFLGMATITTTKLTRGSPRVP